MEKYRDEPLLISALVRIAIGAIAVAPTWEAVQSSEGEDPQLKEVQTTWESVDFLAQAESALAMERPVMKRYFAKARDCTIPRMPLPCPRTYRQRQADR